MRANGNSVIPDADGIKHLIRDLLRSHGWVQAKGTGNDLVREFASAGASHRAQVMLQDDEQVGVSLYAVVDLAGEGAPLPVSQCRIPVGTSLRKVGEAAQAFVKEVLRAIAQRLAEQFLRRARAIPE